MTRFELPVIPLRQLVLGTLGVTAVVASFWFMWRFQHALLLLVAAVILSTAIRPGILWLSKRGISQPLGLLLIFGLIGMLLLFLLWVTFPILGEQAEAISSSLGEGYQFLKQSLQSLPNILIRRLSFILPLQLPSFGGGGAEAVELDLTETLGEGRRLLMAIFDFVVFVMLTFYLTLEGERIKRATFLLLPVARRDDFRQLVNGIELKLRAYLLGQGLLCLAIGLLAFVAYTLIGLPNALLLAVFAGLLEAVPIAGPFIGAVPAILVGLSLSPITALWVIVATIVIQQLENSLLVPRIMNRTIRLRPLVTLLALVAFGSLFGILGALIALPLAAIVQLLLDQFLLEGDSLERNEPGRDQLSVLRYQTNQLLMDVRGRIRRKEDVPSASTDVLEDEMESLALDLESYLVRQGEVQQ